MIILKFNFEEGFGWFFDIRGIVEGILKQEVIG